MDPAARSNPHQNLSTFSSNDWQQQVIKPMIVLNNCKLSNQIILHPWYISWSLHGCWVYPPLFACKCRISGLGETLLRLFVGLLLRMLTALCRRTCLVSNSYLANWLAGRGLQKDFELYSRHAIPMARFVSWAMVLF